MHRITLNMHKMGAFANGTPTYFSCKEAFFMLQANS